MTPASPKKTGFIPWGQMLRVGLRLGLSPVDFWSLSLKEWRWLTGENAAGSEITSAAFSDLMAAFPDGGAAHLPRADNDIFDTYETKVGRPDALTQTLMCTSIIAGDKHD